jgi:hypothetical protein
MDSEFLDAIEEAEENFGLAERKVLSRKEASSEDNKNLEDARKALEEAKAVAKANSVKFVFKSLGRKKYEALVEEFPNPEKQDQDEVATEMVKTGQLQQGFIAWDPDKFPPALIADCSVEPKLTRKEVQELWDDEDWSPSDLAVLFGTALHANSASSQIDLGKD